MPVDNQAHKQRWRQLVQEWRSVWKPWNAVWDRITLAHSRGENPEQADHDLAEQLGKKVEAAHAKMDEHKRKRTSPR